MNRICVTAINEISNVTACAKVQVGQNMTYNDLQTSTDARVTTYEYAEVIIAEVIIVLYVTISMVDPELDLLWSIFSHIQTYI
jgi:hypothetical protein